MRTVAKALGGAVASAATTATTFIVIPSTVEIPWWGYIITGVLNAGIGFGIVYFSPRNTVK
jgi:hypothetical protein